MYCSFCVEKVKDNAIKCMFYKRDKVIDSCELVAIYSDGMSEKYDENSEFEFRNEKITMEEYESIRKDIMGY